MKLDKLILLSLITTLSACGGDSNSDTTKSPDNTIVSADNSTPVTDVGNISFSVSAMNDYFPISPGLTYIYTPIENDASENEETDNITLHISFTSETKIINDISTIARIEREYEDGELLEETTSWITMDSDSAIWVFSETGVEYQDGVVIGEEYWVDGEDGAKRAQLMIAKPQVGDIFTTEQTSEDDIETAEIMSITATLSIEDDDEPTYKDVLHYFETDSDGEEGAEYYYAPGIGLVKFIDDDITMVLTEMDSNTGIAEDIEEETLPDTTSDDDYESFESLSVTYDNFEEEIIMTFKTGAVIEELLIWNPEGKLILELEVNEVGESGLSELTYTFSDVEREFQEGIYTVLADTIDGNTLLGEVAFYGD
jgi:hypothetical protein